VYLPLILLIIGSVFIYPFLLKEMFGNDWPIALIGIIIYALIPAQDS